MRKLFIVAFYVFFVMISSCGSVEEEQVFETKEEEEIIIDNIEESEDNTSEENTTNFKLLSLGDSYTIGQSVCETCRFPEQLKDSLLKKFNDEKIIDLKVIAKTGWTTTNLINAIEREMISSDFDLVTLLIGVNNQYQHRDFSIYESEFPMLIETSIKAAKDDKSNVIVISIPDYAFTPFGNGNTSISAEIDQYNNFAKSYCDQNGITFVNITDITRQGLLNTSLVASDNLHPSEIAYSKFVELILPSSLEILE